MARPKKVVDEDIETDVENVESELRAVEFLFNTIVGGKIYNKGDVVELERGLAEFLVKDGFVRYSK